MKTQITILFSLFLLMACSSNTGQADKARAQQALKPFKMELMHTLKSTLQTEGPLAALEVCKVKAPQIAKTNAPNGIVMGRTSHKLRSQENDAREWVRPLLAHYVSVQDDTTARLVELANNQVGYVEPIYVKTLCLTCHGQPAEPIQAVIDSLYPEDQATGFAEGDFRGLFWVELDRSKAAM